MEILQLFIQDLLGRDTAAAKIFRIKTDEDYGTLPVVDAWHKGVSLLAVIAFNVFFVYYSILRGFQKGAGWQRSFAMACVAQTLIEVLFCETLECLYIHFFVPNMISQPQLKKVRLALQKCIDTLCETCSLENGWARRRETVDAPQYLFVSVAAAKAFPRLMESMVVRSFHSHLPGPVSEKWRLGASSAGRETDGSGSAETSPRPSGRGRSPCSSTNSQSIGSALSLSVTVVAANVISSIPLEMQKMAMRFFEPLLFGGFTLLWQALRRSQLNVLITGVVLFSFSVLFVYKSFFSKRRDQVSASELAEIDVAPELVQPATQNTAAKGAQNNDNSNNDDDEDENTIGSWSSSLIGSLSSFSLSARSSSNDTDSFEISPRSRFNSSFSLMSASSKKSLVRSGDNATSLDEDSVASFACSSVSDEMGFYTDDFSSQGLRMHSVKSSFAGGSSH